MLVWSEVVRIASTRRSIALSVNVFSTISDGSRFLASDGPELKSPLVGGGP